MNLVKGFIGTTIAIFLIAFAEAHNNSSNFHRRCDVVHTQQKSGKSPATWPGAVVPYEFHENLTPADISEVYKAFEEYQSKTCVRFVKRLPNETAYVLIEADDTVCGVADQCRLGIPQSAKFGGWCREAFIMLHELGHTLCFGHEQDRGDRDDYIYFQPECGDMDGWKNDYKEHLYDYASVMHYQCHWCPGGWPKINPDVNCGIDVSPSLSIIDVEKVNDLYQCEGCYSHQFRPLENLTQSDINSLIPGGYYLGQLYICRSYHTSGDILIGNGNIYNKQCYVSFDGLEYSYTKYAQVLTNPKGANYIWQRSLDLTSIPRNAVAGGRTKTDETVYIARCYITHPSTGEQVLTAGKVLPSNPRIASVNLHGTEFFCTDFEILVCDS